MKRTALDKKILREIRFYNKHRNALAIGIMESESALEEFNEGSGIRAAWEENELEGRYKRFHNLNQEYLKRLADAMEHDALYDTVVEL